MHFSKNISKKTSFLKERFINLCEIELFKILNNRKLILYYLNFYTSHRLIL